MVARQILLLAVTLWATGTVHADDAQALTDVRLSWDCSLVSRQGVSLACVRHEHEPGYRSVAPWLQHGGANSIGPRGLTIPLLSAPRSNARLVALAGKILCGPDPYCAIDYDGRRWRNPDPER